MFGGKSRTQAIVCLWLFPRMGTLEVYGASLGLYAHNPGRTASLAKLVFVILHYKGVF